MKKILFTVSFLVAVSASAIFIPLQKDGSVRWQNNADGFIAVTKDNVPATAKVDHGNGDRRPAANNNPDAYVDEGNPQTYIDDTPPPDLQTYTPEPPPRPRKPAPKPYVDPTPQTPTYSGDYSCLKAGFAAAGYKNTSTGYINAVAARSRMIYDGAKSGAFLGIFGGSVDQGKNYKRSLKHAIFVLSALGNCNSKTFPNGVGSDLVNHTASDTEYLAAFGFQPSAIVKNVMTPWNPDGIDNINRVFVSKARGNAQLVNCVKQREPQAYSQFLCRKLIRACSDAVCGKGSMNCGIASYLDCDYKEPEQRSSGGNGNGGNNNGGNNGNNNGGNNGNNNNNNNNGGNNNGNNNGSNNGQVHETPSGSNAESGWGSGGGNGGSDQGAGGPPGTNN